MENTLAENPRFELGKVISLNDFQDRLHQPLAQLSTQGKIGSVHFTLSWFPISGCLPFNPFYRRTVYTARCEPFGSIVGGLPYDYPPLAGVLRLELSS